MSVDSKVVGQPIHRVDALKKVLGKAEYIGDLVLPRMLYGKFLASPISRARIIDVDVSRARRVPGVRAVVTDKEFSYTYGSIVKDRPFLAHEQVRYVGEPVVAVAAESEEAAEDALSLVKVDYEPIEPLVDPEAAMQPGASLIHENLHLYQHSPAASPVPNTNICSHYKLRKGDVEQGFLSADMVYEKTYTTGMFQHAPIEPGGAIVQCITGLHRITVWVGTITPFLTRQEMANALGIPMSNIRIIVPSIGGSFGSKGYMKMEPIALALASYTDGRPVRVLSDREQEFYSTVKGPTKTTIKTGFMEDGTLTARQVTTIWNTGAYATTGPMIARNAGHTAAGPYRIPNVRIDGYAVYTNSNIADGFRGYGTQELCWAYETHMDEIANLMNWDPLKFRFKNALHAGDITSTGAKVDSGGLAECIEKVQYAIGWEGPNEYKAASPKVNTVRGIGVSCIQKASGIPSTSTAIVKLNQDGTVDLLTSTVEQGQGSDTVLTQMVSEELGISVDKVFISEPDTAYTPFDSSTSSSRSTYHMGNAIRLACADAKQQLLEIAAKLLKVQPSEVELDEGIVRIKGQPDKTFALVDIVPEYYGFRGGAIIGRGVYHPEAPAPDPETGQTSKMTPFWMYGAQGAEVEVDLETGRVKILKLVAYHDVGKAINPLNCKQQIEGSVVMGASGTLFEEVRVDSKGITLNANFHDYKLATSLDLLHVDVGYVETAQPDGPYGAKGVGEPALSATAPAIGNAIYSATGVRIRDLPITPERMLAALKAAGKAK